MANMMLHGAAVAVGLAAALGFSTAKTQLTERHLALVSLTYSDGDFVQEMQAHPDGIQARWRAEILQGDRIICASGNGVGGYQSRPVTMDIDTWTGRPGCEVRLIDGVRYTGIASWEYTGEDETMVTVSGDVPFVYERK